MKIKVHEIYFISNNINIRCIQFTETDLLVKVISQGTPKKYNVQQCKRKDSDTSSCKVKLNHKISDPRTGSVF